MDSQPNRSEDALAVAERIRRAALHRQIGALEDKLAILDQMIGNIARMRAIKLRNKLTGLRHRLAQSELLLGSAPSRP